MSLLSLLNGAQSSQTQSSKAYVGTGLSAAAQKALATAKEAASTASTASSRTQAASSQSDVSISPEALAAAQAKEDNAKDFAALSAQVRAALDAHYATLNATGNATVERGSAPDLSALSGRAVAAIALNRTGAFSRTEVQAAKAEMRARIQEDFANAALSSGGSSGGIAAYSSQLVSQYDAMSDEEREARGWTESTRASASAFALKATTPSLWDKLASDA
ncbi:hypothetical protein KFK14_23640 [Sphingobium phenoxybenzoativorans]|uniref:Uncharacterized protein n=1 Tax=Sphingobium phenoxybenzoativorans TaxID=1592790 RepID=A0A975K6X2_9SPHN|nr:hypothetical protein [Sphingobium phenoxybenzoativorans]QUT05885.1 hypothetical protein KFK14_23640 [Sphingobium phenoxybenzoativorans]